LWFEITNTILLQFKIAIPRHLRKRAMEERMRIMAETGQARIVDGHQSAARCGCAVQRDCLESAAREVRCENERVMARAEKDAVVDAHVGIGWRSKRDGSNKGVTPKGASFTDPKVTRPSRISRRAKPSGCR